MPGRRVVALGVAVVGFAAAVVVAFMVVAPSATDELPTAKPSPSAASSSLVPSASIPAPSATVAVRSLGVKCDGRTDDTVALQHALDTVAAGTDLVFPSGAVCLHSGVVDVNTAKVELSGAATLRATDPKASALIVRAAHVVIIGLTLQTVGATERLTTNEQNGLTLLGHTGAIVQHVTITGAAAAGFMAFGARHFVVDQLVVRNTLADCIHNTDGAAYGHYVDPVVSGCGDDGFAVVSYVSDGSLVHDITVDGMDMQSQNNGRGMSVVGGRHIVYRHSTITGSSAAAIYLAAEGPSDCCSTYGDDDVTVDGATIADANKTPSVDHGAVLVYNAQPDQRLSNITVRDVSITNTAEHASRQVGLLVAGSGGADHIDFDDITINGGPATPFSSTAPQADYNIVDWTVNGVKLPDAVGYR